MGEVITKEKWEKLTSPDILGSIDLALSVLRDRARELGPSDRDYLVLISKKAMDVAILSWRLAKGGTFHEARHRV